MYQHAGNKLAMYAFLPLKNVHLPFLATWIKAMAPTSATHWSTLLQLFEKHPQIFDSFRTRSWVMEVNGQPAFCAIYDRYHKAELLESNRFSLLAAPSIQRSPVKLMRAWQASALHIFQQEKPGWLTAELHISEIEEGQALQRIGFHEAGEANPGSCVLYVCKSGELTPVF